jgi:hypothetical protein
MSFTLTGAVTITCEDEHIIADAADFGLEEAGHRHIGDGDHQYEALYIYFDEESRFKVLVQATEFEGQLTLHAPRLDGEGRIVTDELDAEFI